MNQTKLLKKYEPLLRDIIVKRDGNKCSIAGFRHNCGTKLVADHRPSGRGNHSTFLDPRNLTTVCDSANLRAELDAFISKAIVDVVREREGEEALLDIAITSRNPRKWTELEIKKWIDDCKRHFLKNKSGKPKETN